MIPRPSAPSQRVLLGASVDVTTSWIDTCKDSHVTIAPGKAEHDAPGVGTIERETTYTPCNPQPFHVTAACSLACEPIDIDGPYTGGASVSVRTLALGVVTISVDMIHDATHEHRSQELTVEVVRPDAFFAQCMTPDRTWGACTKGLLAEDPRIRIWAKLDGKLIASSLLRVNGAAAAPGSKLADGVSLATLLGTPVSPGPIELVLSLGDKTETLSLEAR